jgi:hypothetical protein
MEIALTVTPYLAFFAFTPEAAAKPGREAIDP